MDFIQNVFNFEGQLVRTINKENEVWFAGKDVCEVLDIKNTTQAIQRLDKDEVAMFNIGGLSGVLNYVNESGLYGLILGSRKTEAKQFKRWVTHEIIPSIRKHGAYLTPEAIESVLLNPDTIIKIATELKEERVKRIQAEIQIQKDKRYVEFAKVVEMSETAVNIGAFVKNIYDKHGISIGRNKLFDWLRNQGYLIKSGREMNHPKQQYIEQGLFELDMRIVNGRQVYTPLITGKGQVKLTKILLYEFGGEVDTRLKLRS